MPRVERPNMSDYGVPDTPEGALPWSWAAERLERNRNFWVVTATPDGRPSAMPVWGVWLEPTQRFWFSTSPTSRKARNIRANPHVAVLAEDTVECVSLEGTAIEVDPSHDPASVDAAVRAWVIKYFDDPSARAEADAFMRSHAIFEVTPTRAFGIIERDDEFSERATRWVWSVGSSSCTTRAGSPSSS